MKIELEIPDTLPHGHVSSFGKGIADGLLESARSSEDHTPSGHDPSRERGKEVGKELYKLIKGIEK